MSAQGLHDADEGDLRQGVSRAGHDVLDEYDALRDGAFGVALPQTVLDLLNARMREMVRLDLRVGRHHISRDVAVQVAAIAILLVDACTLRVQP